MSYFTQELFSIGIFSIASFVLAIVLLLVVYIISFSSKVEIEKSSAYECGFQPFSETSYPFEVQFAIIAIMFLLFDIEVLYLFPLALSLFSLSLFQMIYLAIFFAILSLGIIFEITRNILKFSSTNTLPTVSTIMYKDSLRGHLYNTNFMIICSSFKNYKQYLLAIIILVAPLSVFLSSLSLYITIFLILLWHLLISLPLLKMLSRNYQWDLIVQASSDSSFKSFKHPYFILTIATGIIYPLIWGLFLSLSRYFRLGHTLDISVFIILYIDYLILFLFILPYTVLWFYLIFLTLSQIRQILWEYTESLIFSLHLQALQYYDYFRICQLIHKSHFILYDLFFQYPGAYYRCFSEGDEVPYFIRVTKFFNYLRRRLFICHFAVIVSILIEIIYCSGKIYYGIYILFFYPFTIGLISLYHEMGNQNLVFNMCMSDYITLNLGRPRYYLKFWFLAEDPELWYGFKYNLPLTLQSIYDKSVLLEILMYSHYTRFHTKLPYRVHGYKSNPISLSKMTYPKQYGIKIGNPKPWGIRLAAHYKSSYGVRWFHSSRTLLGPQQNLLHPYTAKFLKDPYTVLALLNKPGQNIAKVQQLSKEIKIWPKSQELYHKYPNIHLDEPKTLTDILESNFVMRFQSLAKEGVILGTYNFMKENYGYTTLETMQMRPDMVSQWIENKTYMFKGYLGIDEKHKVESAKHFGRNQVINSIDKTKYIDLLNKFQESFEKKHDLTDDMRNVLDKLREIAKTKSFDKLLAVWSENLHLFPDKWKPPLMIEKTFDNSHVTPEALEKIRAGEVTIKKISDKLFTLNVSTETGLFPDTSLEHFEDSYMQQLFEQE